MGRMTVGIMDMAENMPLKVLITVVKTTKDNAKFMATPPIQLIIVPKVIIVKFFVHNVCFCFKIPLPFFKRSIS